MTLHMLPNVVYTRFSYRNLRNTSEYCFQLITTMVLTVRQRMQIDVSDSPFSTLVGTSNGHKGSIIAFWDLPIIDKTTMVNPLDSLIRGL